jgi:hypothetical protein
MEDVFMNYWNVSVEERGEALAGFEPQGRFVLHRHCDAEGAHLDLRLEAEGYAVGYRVGGDVLEGAWATEKMPHPVAWLEQDGDAVRADSGVYAVISASPERREIALHGESGVRVVRFEREAGLDASSARAVAAALREVRALPGQAAQLLRDGVEARSRAVERLCGLGRELDGAAFDERCWRTLLEGASLGDVQAHLRGYEARFDARYPPQPVSAPEALEGGDDGERVLRLVTSG